jgi:cell division protein FtsB
VLRAIAGARYVHRTVAKQVRRSNVEHRSYEWAVRGLAGLAIALLYALFLSPSGIPKLRSLENVLKSRSDAVVERIRINSELETKLEGLRNDDRTLEEVARSSGFARPAEIILVLPDPPTATKLQEE